MASMAFSAAISTTHSLYNCTSNSSNVSLFVPRIIASAQSKESNAQMGRRELILKCSELAVLGAIFNFRYTFSVVFDIWVFVEKVFGAFIINEFVMVVDSGKKPGYLGVQKNLQALALCPATKNCISTSEDVSDKIHYAPPWNYNPEDGRGKKKPVSKEEAMDELLQAIKSTKPDKFTPRILEKKDDYIRVEYESPILGFVDDVEFWFPPGKKPIVEYRSASRLGNFDFDVNRKRIKALRLELEKKGWASEGTF
ncbi:hypothetical protein IFM89_023006 [Coptis chinensis]|uniref:Uncharacterized protein n=1 Tax=Coptis chinensis TaxID=261450 RepID=A0A835M1D6_9MAGN|nr:hypothetical protein IFM89_023006 [Coptis chinensis]